MILLVNGDDGTGTGSAGGSLLLLISSESSSRRLVNEKELLVFSTLLEAVLDMDSGSWSDFDKLLLRLLLCDNELLIKSSWSRRSISSEIEFSSDPSSSLVEMLDVIEDDCEMLSMSLSRISLSTNSSDDV